MPKQTSQCVICGASFAHWPYRQQQTCGPACRKRLYALQPRPSPSRVEVLCKQCEQPFLAPPYRAKPFCSRACYATYRTTVTGPAHFNWRGGSVRRDLHRRRWRELRAAKIAEANGRCGVCGKKCRRVDLHHLIAVKVAPALAWEEGNLMVMCGSCHGKLHGAEPNAGRFPRKK